MRINIVWLCVLAACMAGTLTLAHKAEKESEQRKVNSQNALNDAQKEAQRA